MAEKNNQRKLTCCIFRSLRALLSFADLSKEIAGEDGNERNFDKNIETDYTTFGPALSILSRKFSFSA